MLFVRRLVILLLVVGSTVAKAQVDTANARTADGFAAAIATAGATVAKAICTPLQKQDSIVLYDAATGQRLQSTCQVTGKIEEFLQGVPEQAATGVEYMANQVHDTAGFLKYMQSTASGIVKHLKGDLKALETLSRNGTIDLGPTVTRLIRRIKGMEQSDPSCTPATVYPGAQIPTQCVGPVFQLVFSGGSCVDDSDTGVVTCEQPSVSLQKTPGGCNLKYTSSDVIQDRYCAMSSTFGNSSSGTFKHPAEIFNFEKLLSVPNPFNIDLSLYTATAAALASPIKKPEHSLPPLAPGPQPAFAPAPGPELGLNITVNPVAPMTAPAGVQAPPAMSAALPAGSAPGSIRASSQAPMSSTAGRGPVPDPGQLASAFFGDLARGLLPGSSGADIGPRGSVASSAEAGMRSAVEALVNSGIARG